MRRTRLGLVTLLSAVVLALAADPVAAQASATSGLINELNGKLLYVAIPITVITEAILIYTVIRFRRSDDAKPTKENRRLEITWTVATAAVLLFVGVASYGVLANPNVTYMPSMDQGPGQDDVVVEAEAYQWGWNMRYPEEGNISAPSAEGGPQIVIPKDTDVYFEITSTDVIHGFAVPELGLKQDAMPGATNTIKTVAYEEGTYQGYCTEYCGVAHSQMYFTVKVVSQEEYQQFLEEQQSTPTPTATPSGNSTATATATPSGTSTTTGTSTATPSGTSTATPTSAPTATGTATATPSN
ncbi:cytochrome c oxidase subunit II [Salinigranum rubrum]|uniref:cytochrome-c oxidase n=1 Tax=Salinigranum rubrum TaxID=755307 RepID=A0A2I8VJU5_9EURY|nr:cytochrome c oxidase subunit II [Salinigranum rubrum]AUV81349.1 cytochrome c oxidase subunit II [Salinigranum rubrum]